MSHPYNDHREHKQAKARVMHILGRSGGGRSCYARGGAVAGDEDSEFETDREIAGKHERKQPARAHLDGKRSKHRLDRKAGGRARRHGDEAEDRNLVRAMVKPGSLRARGGSAHKFIQNAIKHPGIEKAKAKRAGISTHAQLVKDSHSSDPHVRGRGLLGLRLSAMAKNRAAGGRAGKGKGKTVVNVIVAKGGAQDAGAMPQGMPPMAAMPRPAIPPPRPAMPPPGPPPGVGGLGGPPGMAPPMLPGGPSPGLGGAPPPIMPPRAKGGRIGVRNQGPGDRMPKQPPGWRSGERHKTPPQHTDGKIDTGDMGRGRPVTYARGGGAFNPTAKPMSAPSPGAGIGDGKASARARNYEKQPSAGSRSGVARIEKARSGVL
jgi:hypothetical protein